MTLVQWREWGEEAFAEAQAQDKPILLDIGAVWCHWCHVMDHGIEGDRTHTGTYSDPDIARVINRDFVAVKVDTDRLPHVNARYNMGGWPTTAFLTPEGHLLYGETYVTPTRMRGLLGRIADYYRSSKSEIASAVEQHQRELAEAEGSSTSGAATSLSQETIDIVASSIKSSFDSQFGGFGSQPKFPHPDAILFAVDRYAATGDQEMRRIAEETLLAMEGGGTYDQFAGGFFRYSTTRDWSIPHFEKMLQDNARLSRVCILAARYLGDDKYFQIAKDVHRWLFDVMYDVPTSTFAGSQDADKEDKYYGRPLDERATMPTPYIDRTVYVDWNALTVSSLVERYRFAGEPQILETAVNTYRYIADHIAPKHFLFDGVPGGPEHLLTDLTALLEAALDLFDVTADARFCDEARGIADLLLVRLFDRPSGGFLDCVPDQAGFGALKEPRKDMAQNADAAIALLRLSAFTGVDRYHDVAVASLEYFQPTYARASFFASGYASAVQAAISPPLHVVIVGDPADQQTTLMQRTAWSAFAPCKAVENRTPESAGEYPPSADGSPVAYVCVGTSCNVAEDAEELQHALGPASRHL